MDDKPYIGMALTFFYFIGTAFCDTLLTKYRYNKDGAEMPKNASFFEKHYKIRYILICILKYGILGGFDAVAIYFSPIYAQGIFSVVFPIAYIIFNIRINGMKLHAKQVRCVMAMFVGCITFVMFSHLTPQTFIENTSLCIFYTNLTIIALMMAFVFISYVYAECARSSAKDTISMGEKEKNIFLRGQDTALYLMLLATASTLIIIFAKLAVEDLGLVVQKKAPFTTFIAANLILLFVFKGMYMVFFELAMQRQPCKQTFILALYPFSIAVSETVLLQFFGKFDSNCSMAVSFLAIAVYFAMEVDNRIAVINCCGVKFLDTHTDIDR